MVSLIVTTIDRVGELERLLASLETQTYRDFEVIVVDQNPDERLAPVLQAHPKLAIRHLRSGRGAARGRNTGLPLAQGEVVGFPDDDCWYPDHLLADVVAWFGDHSEFAVLFTCVRDADNVPVGPNWPKHAGVVTRRNVWDIGLAAGVFLRRGVTDATGLLDENIGVGSDSRYQSGEETDYYLRALERGFYMWFEHGLTVHHPNLHSLERLRSRTYPFALGAGYVMGVHRFSWWYLGERVVRSVGGAAVSLVRGEFAMADIYLKRCGGLLRGYLAGRAS